MADHLRVMISSTARDLPEHRKEVMDACLRQGMFPVMMEHLPASDDEAISASLKMVDDADIYLLILAHRYGHAPKANNPTSISITEMEYSRAVERKIRRAVFIVDKTKSLADFTIEDIDTGESAIKLRTFKQRVELENIVNYFKSPEDLRAHVINSLSQHRQPDLTAFHYVSDIPAPPEPYIAHPYTLLQTHTLIGRQAELKLLTDWITDKELEFEGQKAPAASVRLMNVVAIGGMGKSAVTWKWFNDVAPQEMKNLAGRMWWSFYESDATFENFVIRALVYASQRTIQDVTQIPAPERETQLLAALDRQPFLFVLDGLERILNAYARMDAARLDDSDVGKEKNLRKTADPRVGGFLKKLAQVKQSRILVSSRLYPADLETSGGDPIPGGFRIRLEGLTDEDAVELWRAFGVSGSRDELLPIFNTFAKHPLLIQALAGEVKRYRKAPGDFEKWRKANQEFDPSRFPETKEAMAHVLEYALGGLDEQRESVLQTIAAFRMPTSYDTVTAVLVGENKPCINEPDLDAVLSELEDRGLVGWDKRANRYDLHPIVRGVVWSGLGDDARRGVYTSLHEHFETVPMIADWHKVNSFEDLTPAIELYNTLIGLGRYDDAFRVFRDRLSDATLYRLSASRQQVELLEMLFPMHLERFPCLKNRESQSYVLHELAQGYRYSGQPARSVPLFHSSIAIDQEIMKDDNHDNLCVGLGELSDALLKIGALWESKAAACRALVIFGEQRNQTGGTHSLYYLGVTLAALGQRNQSETALRRALRFAEKGGSYPPYDYQAICKLWFGRFKDAYDWAAKALALCEAIHFERGIIRGTRAQGAAALGLNDLAIADERLHHALTRARMVNHVDEELPALVALSELRRRQGDLKAARELLDDVWEAAERGPYPLFHADAFNVLAQIEHDEGNRQAAIGAATKAYQLAWCDGPPFAYHWGLEKAKQHLKELGASEPELPPFDESKFEPMPEVEINPRDEFYVDETDFDASAS